ncbi:hypothetical protein OF83DRAFT_1180178, partial [Amylostereum chailletii]
MVSAPLHHAFLAHLSDQEWPAAPFQTSRELGFVTGGWGQSAVQFLEERLLSLPPHLRDTPRLAIQSGHWDGYHDHNPWLTTYPRAFECVRHVVASCSAASALAMAARTLFTTHCLPSLRTVHLLHPCGEPAPPEDAEEDIFPLDEGEEEEWDLTGTDSYTERFMRGVLASERRGVSSSLFLWMGQDRVGVIDLRTGAPAGSLEDEALRTGSGLDCRPEEGQGGR